MRRLLALALLLVGCSSTPPPKGSSPAEPASAELVEACAKHLELLHRARLARDLGPALAKLAGPSPSDEDLAASRQRLRTLGLKAEDADLARAGRFATVAAARLDGAKHRFLSWTPDLDDVGLARVRTQRPGRWKQLWSKGLDYEVLLLDGFLAQDYPRLREEALEHAEAGRDVPRTRSRLLVIDAAAMENERGRLLADARPERRELRALLEKVTPEALLEQVELREAAYLRFQDEVRPHRIDAAVIWLEILEGNPDLALEVPIGAGDGPDELRRQRAREALVAKLAESDKREERPVLPLPRDQRNQRLKELAPHHLRAELEGR